MSEKENKENKENKETPEAAPKKKGFNRWANKHRIPGKHKLSYDSIFKGKKDDDVADETNHYRHEGFEIDRMSSNWETKYDNAEYNRLKELKEVVYDLIITKTDINLKSNRRKPSRTNFNIHYDMLIENLDMSKFSYGEVFLEFAYYFSESEYNMFKLLDQKWGTIIVKELSTKYNIKKIDGVDFI